LSGGLLGFLDRVNEGQSNMPGLNFKLRQDGVAKGFGGDTGAIGYKKDGASWHGESSGNNF
jgi:hypothetical protein